MLKLFILLILNISLVYIAHSQEPKKTNSCDHSLAEQKAEVQFPPYSEAFQYGRGLIDPQIKNSSEASIKAKSLGLMDWGLRIYPVNSLEQALAHYNIKRDGPQLYDITMQPFYLLLPPHINRQETTQKVRDAINKLPPDQKAEAKKKQKEKAIKEYQSLIDQGARLVYLHRDKISIDRMKRRLAELKAEPSDNPFVQKLIKTYEDFINKAMQPMYHYKEVPLDIVNSLLGDDKEESWQDVPAHVAKKIGQLDYSYLSKDDGEFFYQLGWFAPEIHGVVHLDKFMASSNFKEMRKLANNLLSKGYQFTINKNPRLAIMEADDMIRSEKKTKGGSRFNEEYIKTYEALVKTGQAYSIEVWHPTGVLAGATFGLISNGVPSGESVFYPRKDDPDVVAIKELFNTDPQFAQYAKDPLFSKSIDFGKLVIYLLVLNAHQNGVKFIDAGMVTPFTRTLTGEYMWFSEYLKMLEDAKQHAPEKMVFMEPQGQLAPGVEYTTMKAFVKKHKK